MCDNCEALLALDGGNWLKRGRCEVCERPLRATGSFTVYFVPGPGPDRQVVTCSDCSEAVDDLLGFSEAG